MARRAIPFDLWRLLKIRGATALMPAMLALPKGNQRRSPGRARPRRRSARGRDRARSLGRDELPKGGPSGRTATTAEGQEAADDERHVFERRLALVEVTAQPSACHARHAVRFSVGDQERQLERLVQADPPQLTSRRLRDD
jgi:hypothetical protein